LEPQQKVVKPSFGWNFHFAVPVRASSAITVSLMPVVMYIVPPTTIGEPSNDPVWPVWYCQSGTTDATFLTSI